MNSVSNLINAIGCAPTAPRYRERPRVDLASGVVTGHTIQFSAGISAIAALDLACRLAALVSMPVSVRVDAPLQSLPALINMTLASSGIRPGRLEVAIAGPILERAGIDCLVALSSVRDLGVDLALHDFGGPGTLGLVHRLPLSVVILKPSVILGLPGDATATALLHTLLGIACGNGLNVVATGIESEAQRALLSGLGCGHGEGSLFGTPALQRDSAFGGPNPTSRSINLQG